MCWSKFQRVAQNLHYRGDNTTLKRCSSVELCVGENPKCLGILCTFVTVGVNLFDDRTNFTDVASFTNTLREGLDYGPLKAHASNLCKGNFDKEIKKRFDGTITTVPIREWQINMDAGTFGALVVTLNTIGFQTYMFATVFGDTDAKVNPVKDSPGCIYLEHFSIDDKQVFITGSMKDDWESVQHGYIHTEARVKDLVDDILKKGTTMIDDFKESGFFENATKWISAEQWKSIFASISNTWNETKFQNRNVKDAIKEWDNENNAAIEAIRKAYEELKKELKKELKDKLDDKTYYVRITHLRIGQQQRGSLSMPWIPDWLKLSRKFYKIEAYMNWELVFVREQNELSAPQAEAAAPLAEQGKLQAAAAPLAEQEKLQAAALKQLPNPAPLPAPGTQRTSQRTSPRTQEPADE